VGAYPWLFLFGKGVPSKSSEPKKWFEFLFNYSDNRFASEHTFILSLFNQQQRHAAAVTIAAKIKANRKK
jgi:hypothetical protein